MTLRFRTRHVCLYTDFHGARDFVLFGFVCWVFVFFLGFGFCFFVFFGFDFVLFRVFFWGLICGWVFFLGFFLFFVLFGFCLVSFFCVFKGEGRNPGSR